MRLPRLLGSHLSAAGGLVEALARSGPAECAALQVFTRNQHQWHGRLMSADEVTAWRQGLRSRGWNDGRARVVSHASYLINIASPSAQARARSIRALREELERCEALGIGGAVLHPGAHLGERPPAQRRALKAEPTTDEAQGISRAIRSLDAVHAALPGVRARTLLETTVGAGTTLGGLFAHLAQIANGVRDPDRIGFCIDTCHVTAAGYDMSTDESAAEVMKEFSRVCGLGRVGAVHFNDSVGSCGSHRDRHAHIGAGTCGTACFRAILSAESLADVPMILETPKGGGADGHEWDRRNLNLLRAMERAT